MNYNILNINESRYWASVTEMEFKKTQKLCLLMKKTQHPLCNSLAIKATWIWSAFISNTQFKGNTLDLAWAITAGLTL